MSDPTNLTNINWYPGHMAKAKREMSEQIKLVDLVIEVRDCRIPLASENPLLKEVIGNKPRLLILAKKDKAEEAETQKWLQYFKNQNITAIALNLLDNKNITNIISNACNNIMIDKINKLKAKGLKNVEIRAMVVGIPNVGKSTLINSVNKKKVAATADKPGVTKNLKWIKVSNSVALLDTPGVLWPKFADVQIGYKLAVCGSINDNVLPMDEVVNFALDYLKENYPNQLIERYQVENFDHLLEQIANNRKCFLADQSIDYLRVNHLILKDIRDNQLKGISWEKVSENG